MARRRLLTATTALLLALAAPAGARADDVTPDGPATLAAVAPGCPVPAIPPLLATTTGVRIVVGAGSRAGRVRIRLDDRPVTGWFDLPGAPGTYEHPIDRTTGSLGRLTLDQESGGLAVLQALPPSSPPCRPGVEVRAGDPPPGAAGAVTTTLTDRALAVTPILAADENHNLVPDDEEQTDLVAALAPEPARGPTTLVAIVLNRGQVPVGDVRVRFAVDGGGTVGGGLAPCASAAFPPSALPPAGPAYDCDVRGPIPPGGSVRLVVPVRPGAPGPTRAAIQVSNVAPDLVPADNAASVVLQPPVPQLTLLGPTRRALGAPVRLRVRSDRTGTFALTARVALPGGRTLALPTRSVALTAGVRRVVTVQPTAAQARSLRRAVRPGRSLVATVALAGDDAAPRTLAVRLRAPG